LLLVVSVMLELFLTSTIAVPHVAIPLTIVVAVMIISLERVEISGFNDLMMGASNLLQLLYSHTTHSCQTFLLIDHTLCDCDEVVCNLM